MGDYGDAFMRKDMAGPPARTKAQNRATVQQLKLVFFTSLVLCVDENFSSLLEISSFISLQKTSD